MLHKLPKCLEFQYETRVPRVPFLLQVVLYDLQDPNKNLKAIMNHAGLNKRMIETDKYTPEVEEGDIIIFPSYLQHTVPAGKYNSHRVTIALNLNVPL